jgi:hypothetical protein
MSLFSTRLQFYTVDNASKYDICKHLHDKSCPYQADFPYIKNQFSQPGRLARGGNGQNLSVNTARVDHKPCGRLKALEKR